jgi:hypothetical protein
MCGRTPIHLPDAVSNSLPNWPGFIYYRQNLLRANIALEIHYTRLGYLSLYVMLSYTDSSEKVFGIKVISPK